MALGSRFQDLPWISWGANCNVYEVNEFVVVKIPKPGGLEEKEQFRNEVKILDLLSHHPHCPQLVSCFLYGDDGIFLEYMKDICLSSRIQYNLTTSRKPGFRQTIKVDKIEPIELRTQWMTDLAKGAAHLESLGLAHGDLRPENILLDQDRLKLSDFDCTMPIGTDMEVCSPPYARDLGPEAGVDEGSPGKLGARTEQFALGSLFYLINYGFEVYGDQSFGDDPTGRDHYVVVGDLFQRLEFPELNKDPAIDAIITKCWHGGYASISELATSTTALRGPSVRDPDLMAPEIFTLRQQQCKDLKDQGLLDALSDYDPQKCGRKLFRR